MSYRGMTTSTITYKGHNGDEIEAYIARPEGDARVPGVVVIHHMPGWDEWTTDVVRKFAHHGYAAIAPHLYSRAGPGTPDDLAARVRAEGGVSDDQVVGDVEAAAGFLRSQPYLNGKVGCIGFCSGGRHAYLCAARIPTLDAAVDCWGGGVTVDDPSQLNERRPVAPIDLTPKISCPVLGIFGNDDRAPSPEQVDRTEKELKKHGKTYEFYRYDGAGHGFFATNRPGYRPEQSVDGWNRVFAFYEKHLSA
jgi:carboxymethylenebutenolidase